MMRTSRGHTRRRGFTLIELMMALVAGSLVIAAAWRMSGTSSELFNRITRRTDMGRTLRRASAILRRDITRAGYLSIRDNAEMPNCGSGSVTPVDQPGIEVRSINGEQVLFVTGNLTSNDQYRSDPLSVFNQVTLDTTNDVYRFSFVNPVDGAFQQNEFLRAFVPNPDQPLVQQGRYISISKGNFVFLRQLTSIQFNGLMPTLTFSPALPSGGGCFKDSDIVYVAPVATYQYRLEDSSAAGVARITNTDALSGTTRRRLLVRREIDMATRASAVPTVVPNSEIVLLDFVDAFHIGAAWDTTPQVVPVGAPVLAYTDQPETLPSTSQWLMRSVVVDLRIRPPGERTVSDAALQRQQTANEGRRWAHFEVNLPNMARRPGVLQ